MSTQVYESEHTVYYADGKPTTYFGWTVSTSGDDCHGEPFPSKAARAAFVAALDEGLAPLYTEEERGRGYLTLEIAALFALSQCGHEGDRDFAHVLLTSLCVELDRGDEIMEVVESEFCAYDFSEEVPGTSTEDQEYLRQLEMLVDLLGHDRAVEFIRSHKAKA